MASEGVETRDEGLGSGLEEVCIDATHDAEGDAKNRTEEGNGKGGDLYLPQRDLHGEEL